MVTFLSSRWRTTTVLTLLRSGNALADPAVQVARLEQHASIPRFQRHLADLGLAEPTPVGIDVLQVNLGKLCNQTCAHCHVDAGPDRREQMSADIATACLDVLDRAEIATLDVTGGAPEMNPVFRTLVTGARRLGRRVIDRCNLTILVAPGFTDLPEFLAANQVEVVASLPCYLESNVDRQRGDGVFDRSLTALRRLNALGYGRSGSSLSLTLVFNPVGPSLPPPQARLEQDYRRELASRYGIEFTRLYTITNMPISRFLADLIQTGRYDLYLEKLVAAFNPATLDGLMCRQTLSVDWQGRLFDCDFNQMLDLPLVAGASPSPWNIRDLTSGNLDELLQRRIVLGRHCYGCTAGSGSSCSGSLQ